MHQSLDLVLPCYNPPDGWVDNILDQYEAIDSAFPDITLRLIIVNDCSPMPIPAEDIERLDEAIPGFHWLEQRINRGKGAALRKGMAMVDADVAVFTDIDFPYTTESTLALTEKLLRGDADIVVGQRSQLYYEKTPWQRKMISKWLKWFNKNILRVPVADSQVGLKGFNQKGLHVFNMTTINRYLFDLEFLILASRKKRKLKIEQVEVTLREDVIFSQLNWKILVSELMNIVRIIFTAWLR